MGLWYYRVRVEDTRKELSYLRTMGAVTSEGNFNRIYTVCSVVSRRPETMLMNGTSVV